jgi:uncharacterized protein YkwD
MGTTVRRRFGSRRGLALLATGVLGLGILGAACAPVDATPPPPHCPTSPADPISLTIQLRHNEARAANGLPGLWWSPRLACLAQDWSNWMAFSGKLAHRDLGAAIRSPGFEDYASLAENILVGPGNLDGHAIHDAWMRSPGHYANIMGNFQIIGIGIARSGDGRLWATANFGRKM